jgi:hypothetical protein
MEDNAMTMRVVNIRYLTDGVAPCPVVLDLPADAPAIHTGWGDRVHTTKMLGGRQPLPVWVDPDRNGIECDLRADGPRLYSRGCIYDGPTPAWLPAVLDAIVAIRAAADAAERERPDVAAAVESYAALMREIDAHLDRVTAITRRRLALSVARELYGRRRQITRAEAAVLIGRLIAAGASAQGHSADWWSQAVTSTTVVSVGGVIRYDQPGSAHPRHRTPLALVASGQPEVTAWAHAHAERTFVVVEGK